MVKKNFVFDIIIECRIEDCLIREQEEIDKVGLVNLYNKAKNAHVCGSFILTEENIKKFGVDTKRKRYKPKSRRVTQRSNSNMKMSLTLGSYKQSIFRLKQMEKSMSPIVKAILLKSLDYIRLVFHKFYLVKEIHTMDGRYLMEL